ncbi:MAG: cupin domain-containing protein [candidate division KSB1 bacterium]|nr:cupin domain-containing protein [candidate division KSB1 bacterium]MDQ7065985.1 cupin domain-containing protein [candidate division KSB1 bacterium]
MAKAGDVIENPLSGEKIFFDKTGEETNGESLCGRIVLAPQGIGPPEHIHPIIEERFKVVSGQLHALVNGKERMVSEGEELIVPPGTAHRWWNTTDDEVHIEYVVSPALPLDRFLESVFALVQAGKANKKGLPGPLRMAPILQKHWDVLYLANPPLFIQKIVMGVLAVVARLIGYGDEYRYPYKRASE